MVKTVDTSGLMQKHSFVKVVGDNLVPDGLNDGDELYVVNIQALPVDDDDLYNQRLHMMCHKLIENGGGLLDLDDILILDPKDLSKVSKGRNRSLLKKLEKKYGNRA